MPARLIAPARATASSLARAAGAIVIAALVALAFIQANRTNDAVQAIRGIAPAQRAAQVAGCHRGNLLRDQVNRNVFVLAAFIREAAAARRASGDGGIADRYTRLLPKLSPLARVDCEHAFPPVTPP